MNIITNIIHWTDNVIHVKFKFMPPYTIPVKSALEISIDSDMFRFRMRIRTVIMVLALWCTEWAMFRYAVGTPSIAKFGPIAIITSIGVILGTAVVGLNWIRVVTPSNWLPSIIPERWMKYFPGEPEGQ